MNFNLTAADFYKIVARYPGRQGERQAQIIKEMGGNYAAIVEQYAEINTFNRHKHFLAQICEESWGLSMTHELASGVAYEGRKDLGNIHPGDGPRYKGRTLLDLTGRANMEQYGQEMKLDLIAHPELLEVWPNYLIGAALYWRRHNINHWADQDNLIGCTHAVNGGTNGLADRRTYLTKAKQVLNAYLVQHQPGVAVDYKGHQPLYRGMIAGIAAEKAAEEYAHCFTETAVVQTNLVQHGSRLTIDGDFGAATELAVKQFQVAVGLPDTGVVDACTWAELLQR